MRKRNGQKLFTKCVRRIDTPEFWIMLIEFLLALYLSVGLFMNVWWIYRLYCHLYHTYFKCSYSTLNIFSISHSIQYPQEGGRMYIPPPENKWRVDQCNFWNKSIYLYHKLSWIHLLILTSFYCVCTLLTHPSLHTRIVYAPPPMILCAPSPSLNSSVL